MIRRHLLLIRLPLPLISLPLLLIRLPLPLIRLPLTPVGLPNVGWGPSIPASSASLNSGVTPTRPCIPFWNTPPPVGLPLPLVCLPLLLIRLSPVGLPLPVIRLYLCL